MARVPFDDELPDALPQPSPGGWFELFCCSSVVLAFIAAAVAIALASR